ncbi:hypothetical protein KFU94_50615 [Chloroflexi bacterium TSY]|nr:hypothetical protein [Chloroflexi bacterium TSY]
MSIFSARLNSLRWRLLSLLFAVLVIMLLSISLGVANFVSVNEQDAWQARHQEAAHRSVETLKLFLQRVESSLATVGLLDRDYLASSSDVLSSMIAQNPGLLEIIRLDVNGKVIAQAHQDSPLGQSKK